MKNTAILVVVGICVVFAFFFWKETNAPDLTEFEKIQIDAERGDALSQTFLGSAYKEG